MWARGDMKIQIPQKLGLTPFYKLLKLRHKKGAVIARNYLVVTAPIIAFEKGTALCTRANSKSLPICLH